MPYIKVARENSGGVDLYYEDHGTGHPVVLIHGWPQSGRAWEKQVAALLDAGHRVVTYDRRGFGESSRPTFGYDYDTFSEDLHRVLTRLKLRDAALVGFSMGGGEVARYLGTYGSEGVSHAVFISSVTPFLRKTADNPAGVDGSVFDAIERGLEADRPAFLRHFFANFYNVDVLGGKRVSEEAVQFAWNVAVGASPRATRDCVSAWLTDFRMDLSRIDVPTLVVHGDADRIVPIEASGRPSHELVRGSRLVVVEGGSHGLLWTHADTVNHELVEFLGKGRSA
ncbi:MAG TPA: alpha/beta hydrolase [Methylomirabilota bacterium]|jgi:pimeloyl-ACP methyl ester carboxylesterase